MPTEPTDSTPVEPAVGGVPGAGAGAATAVVTVPPDPDGGGSGALGQGRSRGSSYRWVIEWAVILMVVLVATVVLKTYIVQTFYIPSPSMVPTLDVGDRIMVNKLSYDFHGVHRGDIVVFRRPPLEDQNFPDLVKRVIGLPGETISTQNGHVYINGQQLKEPWLPPGPQSYTGALPDDPHAEFNMPGPVKIPPDEYFVMGDNRTDSEDSRYFGPISKSLIVGRAVAVVWPLSRLKGI